MKIRLADIADVRSGYQFRGGVKDEVTEGAPVRVIQIKDVEAEHLMLGGLEWARPRKDVSRDFVRQGDVLLLGRGRRFGATLVDVPVENAIAVHYFWILRPHALKPHGETVTPAYLTWFLNHPTIQSELTSQAHTTHIPVISRVVVEGLLIDVPPLETQNQIARIDALARREQKLAQELTATRAQFFEALTLDLARHNP